MKLRDAVLKVSGGRTQLHHLRSGYFVDVNEKAVCLIEEALARPELLGEGGRLIGRLAEHQMVEEGDFAPLRRARSSELVSLEIEPIGRCNLACRHCFVQFTHQVMTEAVFEAVLEGAQALGAVELTFNGGEPLLHPSTLGWLRRAARSQLRPLLFSNGTLVTAQVAGELAEIGVARVTVSLDGFEPEHDGLRGRGSFRRAAAGVQQLVKAGLQVFVTTLVHPATEATLGAFKSYCRGELGVSGVRVSTIAPLGRAADEPALQLSDAAFSAVYREERTNPRPDPLRQLPCRAGLDKLYVTASGNVHGCHLFEGVSPPLGTLPGSSLEDLHRKVSTSPLGPLLTDFGPEQLSGCAGCPALSECRGGCRARAWALTKQPLGIDPVSCRRYGRPPSPGLSPG